MKVVQVACFYLMYLVVQYFFLLSKLYVSLEISLELFKICKLYGLDLISV